MLGRHASATSESSAVYSRDLATKSVALLQQLINDIHQGVFVPDASRRDYFPLRKAVEVAGGEIEANTSSETAVAANGVEMVSAKVEDVAVDVSSDEGSSESSTTESDCDSSGESGRDEAMPEPQRKFPRGFRLSNAGESFMKHVVSRVVHFADPDATSATGETKVFACGRRPGPNFVPAGQFDTTFMCKLCKTRALKTMNLEL